MQTRVTGLLKTEYPIIQGGMAWVADYHLAAAVSNGGGLGMIGAANAPAEWVAEQIREVRKRTDRPFGVNIMLMSPHADEVARTVARERVPVVTTGAGNPEQYMTLWKEKDIRVIPVIASVAMAKRMEKCAKCTMSSCFPAWTRPKRWQNAWKPSATSIRTDGRFWGWIAATCWRSRSRRAPAPC